MEELLEQRLVADLDGPKEDRKTRLSHPPDLEPLRVDPALAGNEGLIQVDQVQPFRLLDQPGPKVRMGDRYKVHRPLPDVFAVEVGDPVLGDDVVDVAPVQCHAGARL